MKHLLVLSILFIAHISYAEVSIEERVSKLELAVQSLSGYPYECPKPHGMLKPGSFVYRIGDNGRYETKNSIAEGFEGVIRKKFKAASVEWTDWTTGKESIRQREFYVVKRLKNECRLYEETYIIRADDFIGYE